MRPLLLCSLLLLGCQPLQWPQGPEFQSVARDEPCRNDLYYGLKQFHDTTFAHDPFHRILRADIDRHLAPTPQESETTLETWMIESTSGRVYRYTLEVGITREPGIETALRFRILSIDGHPLP